MSDESMAYVGRADCGCIRAAIVDLPTDPVTAQVVAGMVRDGLTIERLACEDVRRTMWTRPDCATHVRREAQVALPIGTRS